MWSKKQKASGLNRRQFLLRSSLTAAAVSLFPKKLLVPLEPMYPTRLSAVRLDGGPRGLVGAAGFTEDIFPGLRENFEGGTWKVWMEDEWSRGAWSFVNPRDFVRITAPEAAFILPANIFRPRLRGCRALCHRVCAQ